MLVSAAAAEMKGIDVDFAFLPIATLTMRGGFEIMSSHYTNFRNAPFFRPTLGPNGEPAGGNPQSVGNATGFDAVRAPKEYQCCLSSAGAKREPQLRRQRLLQQRICVGFGQSSASIEL